jgi:hypothetical protein
MPCVVKDVDARNEFQSDDVDGKNAAMMVG